MAESQRLILKILSGANAGAEAALGARTVVGSAETADIMIGDPGLSPEHFTIAVQGDAVSLTVGDAPVMVKHETRRGGTFPLAAFDLIKFGTTSCAVGPENGTWPAFAAADLLPPSFAPPPAPAAEPDPADAAATADGTADASGPPLEQAPARRSRWPMAAATVVLLLAVLGGGAYLLTDHSPSSEVSIAGRMAAQDILTKLQANGVTIRPDDHGGLVAEGFVATTEQQRRLRQALLDANISVKYRVVSLEQQITAARTIVTASGAQLTVEPDPVAGKLVVEGFLPEMSHFDTLQRLLRRDISDLRPIETRIATPATIADEARKQFAAAGLENTVQVDVTGTTIRISGSVPDERRAAVREVVDGITARWSRMVKIEDTTGSGAAARSEPAQVTVTATPPRGRITVVAAGKDGFVRDGSGRRYGVGDKLANGEIIEEIGVEEVVTSRGGVRYRYTFGRGQ